MRLLAVLAHPDDESLGFGGTLARYAAQGVETFLITATRGEAGRIGASHAVDPHAAGKIRESELCAAAEILNVSEVTILGYPDGALDTVNTSAVVEQIAAHMRRIRPHVVVTFGPDGAYGHPDHIAISQFATAAAICSAPDAPAKLYYLAWRKEKWDAYQAAFRQLTSTVDGVVRQASPWADWAVTTEIDTSSHWPVVWRAVQAHESQISIYWRLQHLSPEHHRALWGSQQYYRAYSTVNGGRKLETDLFEGLRHGRA